MRTEAECARAWAKAVERRRLALSYKEWAWAHARRMRLEREGVQVVDRRRVK